MLVCPKEVRARTRGVVRRDMVFQKQNVVNSAELEGFPQSQDL